MAEEYSLSVLNTSILVLSCVGLALSIYTFYVQFRLETEEDYTPVCDINEHVSCSKVFKSPYAKGFGIFSEDSMFHVPNSLFGIPFYILLMALSHSSLVVIPKFLFGNVVLANFLTPYLAYLLFFVLHDVCVVCVSIYIVNAILLFVVYKKDCYMNPVIVDVKRKSN